MGSMKVLVVNTDSDVSATYRELLSTWKVDASYVSSPQEAYATLSRQRYPVILLDAEAFNDTEPELLEAIGLLSLHGRLIVAIKSQISEDELRTLKLADVDVLKKPVRADELFDTLMRLLEKYPAEDDQTRLLAEIEQKMAEISNQSSKLDRLEQLVGSMLAASQKTPPAIDERDWDRGRGAAPSGIFSVSSLLVQLLEDFRKDDSMKKYEPEIAAIEACIENLNTDTGASCSILKTLSFREFRILSMIKCGMTTDRIADRLHISPDTVKTHRRNIRKKLKIVGAKNDLASFLQHDSVLADSELR